LLYLLQRNDVPFSYPFVHVANGVVR